MECDSPPPLCSHLGAMALIVASSSLPRTNKVWEGVNAVYKRYSRGWTKHLDFILWDVFALQLAFILAYAIRHRELPYGSETYRGLAVMLAAVDVLVAAVFNTMHNVMKRGPYDEAAQTLKHVLLVLAAATVCMFIMQNGDAYSRIIVLLSAAFHFVVGCGIRFLWKSAAKGIGRNGPKPSIVLVADEGEVPEIFARARASGGMAYSGIVLCNRDGTGELVEGVPVVASLETAADYVCREWVDGVFVHPECLSGMEPHHRPGLHEGAEGHARGAAMASLIGDCRRMAVPVHVRLPLPDAGGKGFIEKAGGYAVLTVAANCASPLQLAAKRLMDVAGGLAGSLIALLVIAAAVPKIKKESPGPVLFRQTRIGRNGKKFQIYKIRSMYLDAEERKAELAKENRVADGMMFKLDFDPRVIGNKTVDGKRVTGIGERLRSGSWDEWPQFFNILLGQMSLVGTRPPTVDEWEKYKYHHRARLAVKPGLTGMWQVSGRSGVTDFEEVVRLDTEYINNWSIGLDIRILLKTVKVVLTKDGAM